MSVEALGPRAGQGAGIFIVDWPLLATAAFPEDRGQDCYRDKYTRLPIPEELLTE